MQQGRVTVELGDHRLYNEPARPTILESLEAFLAEHIGAE